jgi:hypothetical protein
MAQALKTGAEAAGRSSRKKIIGQLSFDVFQLSFELSSAKLVFQHDRNDR